MKTIANTDEANRETRDIHILVRFVFSQFPHNIRERREILNQVPFRSIEEPCVALVETFRELELKAILVSTDEVAEAGSIAVIKTAVIRHFGRRKESLTSAVKAPE